jgi:uncharacterized membrane protein YecN with MAPEG domain
MDVAVLDGSDLSPSHAHRENGMAALLTDAWRMAALYIAVNALIMLVLGMLVVRARLVTSTQIGDGGHSLMVRVIRAHGNNTENVPLPVVMMLAVAALGGSVWLVHAIGAPLTAGRLLHGIGVTRSADTTASRLLGMSLSWTAFISGIAALIWLVFGAPR